jgi:hypothetical protein
MARKSNDETDFAPRGRQRAAMKAVGALAAGMCLAIGSQAARAQAPQAAGARFSLSAAEGSESANLASAPAIAASAAAATGAAAGLAAVAYGSKSIRWAPSHGLSLLRDPRHLPAKRAGIDWALNAYATTPTAIATLGLPQETAWAAFLPRRRGAPIETGNHWPRALSSGPDGLMPLAWGGGAPSSAQAKPRGGPEQNAAR